MKTKGIALLHDYFNQVGGSERVFLLINELFGKNADIYTILVDKNVLEILNLKNVKTLLKNIPFDHRYILPLFPMLNRFINIKGHDLIISDSHAWVKNINKPKDALHICYCYTPMRYAWDLRDFYLEHETSKVTRPFVKLLTSYLRKWDYKHTPNVDHFIAISENVKARIKKYYERDSTVIYPPVDISVYRPSTSQPEEFYLIVSRLISFKRVDLAINACKLIKKKLIVLGSGRELERLTQLKGDDENIQILDISGKDTIPYYQRCKGFLFCGEDDFGLTPVEAQACGRPVIAYGKGGALESVIEGKTGHFFYEQTPEALSKAILEFEKMSFNPRICRKNAERFDVRIFKKQIKTFIEDKYKEFKNGKKKNNPP